MTKWIRIHLDEDTHRQLKALAAANGQTIQYLVIKAIGEILARKEG